MSIQMQTKTIVRVLILNDSRQLRTTCIIMFGYIL